MDSAMLAALNLLEAESDNAEALAHLAAVAEGKAPLSADEQKLLLRAVTLHKERGNFELTVRLTEAALAGEKDPAQRAALLSEAGRILNEELLDDKRATAAYERAQKEQPKNETAADALSQMALVRDNWKKIVKKYLDEAKDATDRQLATSLYLSAAESYARYDQSKDGQERVEQYLKKALELDPRNGKAAKHLERIYRTQQRWEPLALHLAERVEVATKKEERVAAYLALADVQVKRLHKRNDAAESYKKALGIDPGSAEALSALIDYYTATEDWPALIRVYENALRARPRGEPEIGMLLQIGIVLWRKIGNLEGADEYWKRVRKAEPAQPVMLEFYRQLYANDTAKLVPILQAAQKVESDPGRRAALGIDMAQLAERGGTVDKAIELWKAVWKSEPAHKQTALDALKRLYEKTEKWNALLDLLKERLEAIPRDDIDARVAGLLEIVTIYRDRLSLDVMVLNTYNNILQLRPDHAQALAALAQKYEALGRWNELIGVLQRTADVSSDNAEKARLLGRIAGLWIEKFSNFNQAVKPLEELYALDPRDQVTANRLRDIYTRRRAWRALLDLERKELSLLSSSGASDAAGQKAQREKLVEMAKLAAEKLGDPREAIALWNRLLESDPSDGDALNALAALYEREKRWPALVETLERQRARQSDVKAQVALLERIGTVFAERLTAPEQAIGAYQQIVRLQPQHQKAMRTLQGLYAQGGRYDELEQLYAQSGQWEELCDVLTGVAEKLPATEQPRRIALYLRVAEIAQKQLAAGASGDRAAKAYERILGIEPTNRAAAEALLPIYRAQEKWARLLATYEIVLQHAPDDGKKLAIIREIQQLCEEKLGSKGLAFSWAAKAYALAPGDLSLEKDLERLAQEAEGWEELVELYTKQVARETDAGRQAERHRQIGRLMLHRLHRADEAQRSFTEVLNRRPDDEEALATLEQIFAQAGDFAQLLGIYRRREQQTTDPQRRLELLFKIAWLEEEQLTDPGAAIVTYQKLLATDPPAAAQARALRALDKLYQAANDSARLSATLERLLPLSADDLDAQVQLYHRLGQLYEGQLKRPSDALAAYKKGLALQPTHKATQTALEAWLTRKDAPPAEKLEVARLFVPIYEQRDDQAKLAETLDIILADTKEPAAELALLRRIGDIYAMKLGDARRAYGYTVSVFGRAPDDAKNRAQMTLLAEQLDLTDDLAIRLGDAETGADKKGDAKLARELGWELGQLFEGRLGMPDDAEAAYRRVLQRDPDDESAHIALVQLYSSRERWTELRALLAARKERARDTITRLQIIFSIADLDEGVLNAEAAAVADYAEVLAIDPASARAFRALDRLYSAQKNWGALDQLLAARIPHATPSASDGDSRAQLLARRGDLHLTRLDDAKGAHDFFEQALAEEPANELGRRGLEALMKQPELRLRAARVLAPLHAADEAWSKLAAVLQAEREVSPPEELPQLLGQLAQLQEDKLGARQLSLQTWREALRLSPGDRTAQDNVERLATLLERWTDLAQAWEDALAAADPHDITLRAELLTKAAHVYESRLNDDEQARSAWRRLLELDPTNPLVSQPAADALARLYQNSERWSELVEVLHRQSGWTDAPAAKKDLLFRIARISDELMANPKAAIGVYREILEVDSEERQALDALERLYTTEKQWPSLVEILRKRIEQEREGARRRDLQWRVAELVERELNDQGEAITGYHAILDEHADDVPALDALARLYEAAKRSADLLDILERRLALVDAASTPDLALGTRLRTQIGALLSQAGRRDQSLERYREVLQRDPQNAPARAALEALLEDEDLRLRAAEVLEPVYAREGDVERRLKLTELFAQHAPDLRERIARLEQIAQLETARGRDVAAFEALARATRLAVAEPDLPQLLDRLEVLAEGHAPELVALYKELGPDVLDAAQQERIYLAVAHGAAALGDQATAREYYRRILDTSPDHPQVLDALERLYAETKEWEPLYEIYARRADMAGDDDDLRRRYLLLLGELCAEALSRPNDAISAYEQALQLQPSDHPASSALERLYVSQGRNADLADLWERRLGFAEDLEEAVSLRYQLAKLYETELSDSDRAVENYRAALGGDPQHAASIAALERFLDDEGQRVAAAEVLEPIYAARHDWAYLVRIYQIRLDGASEPKERVQLTRRIARLYEEQLEDLEGAFTWYGKVFREDPADRAIRDQLSRLAGVLSSWAELAALYEDYLQDVAGDNSATALEIWRALALVFQERVGDVDGARRAYQHLLEVDANDAWAFGSLERLLHKAGRFRDLLDVYRDSATHTLDEARNKELLGKQALILEHELNDPDGAIEVYRALLDLDSQSAETLGALDRLYVQQKRWHDLVELLIRRLDSEGSDRAVWTALKLRLGGLYEVELDDATAAIDLYEEVLVTPGVDKAGQGEAVRALERLIIRHDHTFRIAQILEPIYRAQDSWQKLVVIYDAELQFIEERPRRIALLAEIAGLHEQRGADSRMAFTAWGRAFTEQVGEEGGAPEDEERFYKQLTRLAGPLQAWSEVVRLLEENADKSYDAEVKARLYARAATLYDAPIGNAAQAIASWRKVVAALDSDPTSTAAAEAWLALERLLARDKALPELVVVLERRAALDENPTSQKELLRRAAELYEGELAQPERAVSTYRQITTVDEGDHGALEALERLYRARGDWRDLIEVYQRLIGLGGEAARIRALRLAAAEVDEKQLHDVPAAIELLVEARAAAPDDEAILAELSRLYQTEQQWPELLETLDQRIELAGKRHAPQRWTLTLEAARVLEEQLSDVDAAIRRFAELLESVTQGHVDPELPEVARTVAALERLVKKESTRDAAADVLEPYRSWRNDFAGLVELAELRLQGESDPARRRELLARIAELTEAGIEDMPAAFAVWARMLKEDAGDEQAQTELERLSELQHAPNELARVYEAELAASFDTEVQRTLAWKLGQLYERKLGDDARAITAYQRALDLPGQAGGERGPLDALDRLLERGGRFRELADVLEKEAAIGDQPSVEARFWGRLGALRMDQLGELDSALVAYREAIEREPNEALARQGLNRLLSSPAHTRAALDLLEPVAEAEENHATLDQLAQIRVGITGDTMARAELYEQIAERAEKRLNDPGRALEAISQAFLLRPDEPHLVDEVERLAQAHGNLARAGEVFESALAPDKVGALMSAGELGLRTARLWLTVGDEKRAETRLLAVLDSQPTDGEALAALEQIYRRRQDQPQLAAILERRAADEMDTVARRRMLGEAAHLHADALNDPTKAIALWREVRDGDESDREAMDALMALYQKTGQAEAEVELVMLMAASEETPAERQRLRRQAAHLLATTIGDLERAAGAYRDLLDEAPEALDVLDELEAIERKRGDMLAVQEVLVRRLGAVGAGAAQIPVYAKLAQLAVERESPDDAIGYWHEVLAIAPEDGAARHALESLLERAERWHDLVETFMEQADRRAAAKDTAGELTLLVRAASIWEERLDSAESATEILERVLARDPNNVRALTTLARIYESARDLPRARQTLERAAELAPSGSEAAELHFRMGRLEAEANGDEAASTYYMRALAADSGHEPSSQALEQIARQAGDWSHVAELLESRLAHASSEGDAQRPIVLELAKIYGEKLKQPAQALPHLEALHRQKPDDAEVLAPLADLYLAAGRLDDAMPIYKSLVEKMSKGKRTKETAKLHQRLGLIAEQKGEQALALEQYNAAYQIDPAHTQTLDALGRLYMAQSEWEKARRIYRAMLLGTLDPAAGITKGDVYLHLGEIHEKLNEAPKAIGMYERGLEADANHAALKAALQRLRPRA